MSSIQFIEMDMNRKILIDQIAYYKNRAKEYDEWFLRKGRYDYGPELNRQWQSEVTQVRAALETFAPHGEILELACGTGLWTKELARYARTVTAVDASPEMLGINRSQTRNAEVRYIQADIFQWRPDRRYDVVFFGFWLSHVPPVWFDDFWGIVRDSMAPSGRVFFIDSLYEPTTTANDQPLPMPNNPIMKRRLNDGREYQIFKVFYNPRALQDQLSELGWRVAISTTARYFLYGMGKRESPVGEESSSRSPSS